MKRTQVTENVEHFQTMQLLKGPDLSQWLAPNIYKWHIISTDLITLSTRIRSSGCLTKKGGNLGQIYNDQQGMCSDFTMFLGASIGLYRRNNRMGMC